VDRPFLTLFGEEQYPGPFLKAAVMMENIIQGHPFTDGNKRTGYLAGITLLELLTGLTVEATDEEIVGICLSVEAKETSVQGLADWMEAHAVPADEEE
jgi:death-on-curing protein